MVLLASLFLALQELIGMEHFAQHLIATAQLVLIGKDQHVLQLLINVLLELYGMA